MHPDVVLLDPSCSDTEPDAARLGQKGAGLFRMMRLGLPVPSGVVLCTSLWPEFASTGQLSDRVWDEVRENLALVANKQVSAFGDAARPLLLSVRSGSEISMPGMLETLCNVGLTKAAMSGLASRLGDERFALDCRHRFLHKYATTVLGLRADGVPDPFDARRHLLLQKCGVACDHMLFVEDLRDLCSQYEDDIFAHTGQTVPDDAWEQLKQAVYAVLRSFHAPRAVKYRQLQNIPSSVGMAVTLQAMVFGNAGKDSSTGVAFSRDPRTGAIGLCGEYLQAAQGDDLLSGAATPAPLLEMRTLLPAAYQELEKAAVVLDSQLADLQEIEFTVERSQLFLLQTRPAKRSAQAMVCIAKELCESGRSSTAEALGRIDPSRVAELFAPTVDADGPEIVRGLPASPGAVIGQAVFTSQDAVAARRDGIAAILCRSETSTDDIAGIEAAVGLLTTRGGTTSHAAVIARGLGRCAVVGCSALWLDAERKQAATREHRFCAGDLVTLDGNRGRLLLGAQPLSLCRVCDDPALRWLINQSRSHSACAIWVHSSNETELAQARSLGFSTYLKIGKPQVPQPCPSQMPTPDLPKAGWLLDGGTLVSGPAIEPVCWALHLHNTLPEESALVATLKQANQRSAPGPGLRGLVLGELLVHETRLYALAVQLGLDFLAVPAHQAPVAGVFAARATLLHRVPGTFHP